MMTNHNATPDEQVRLIYSMKRYEGMQDRAAAEFDAWLASVRADAWDEGWKHAGKVFKSTGTGPRTRNPYRP